MKRMAGDGRKRGGLEGGDFDLIHARVVIRGEVTGIQPEQTPAAIKIVHIVELSEIVLIETPVEFYSQLDERRCTEVGKVRDAENVTV